MSLTTAPQETPRSPTPVAAAKPQREQTPWRRFVAQFIASKLAVTGLIVLVVILLIALFAPLLSPQNPYDLSSVNILDNFRLPGERGDDGMLFVLGTDEQGRDILSAVMYGLRISIAVGVVSTIIALVVGATLGLLAGFLGGRIEAIVMRVADLQLSFPPILLALILLALLGRGIGNIVIALVAVQWAYYARTTRSAALVERRKEYIEAATCLGLPTGRIMFRHLLPNCLPPLIVIAALQVASAITLEATLSFLGLGVPVTEPSLGSLIANGQQFLLSGKYWISFFPGIALVTTIVAMNLVADQLRDVLNPRLQTQ
ncbi:ABC transporter permease [Cupriavidus pampae]|uniref:D,D-dipeptide transport system permease protein DdpC n=1 Tax=Cupriavidus pampae TaxID=659251 RepID=A0ABN7Z2G3_9BURK|nr:ABC transporter permease [Cupriavidus pampae]CAG9178244.1 putative D,D-dipeptide transport system permease protein DdpC [Cupriavidus pampae]